MNYQTYAFDSSRSDSSKRNRAHSTWFACWPHRDFRDGHFPDNAIISIRLIASERPSQIKLVFNKLNSSLPARCVCAAKEKKRKEKKKKKRKEIRNLTAFFYSSNWVGWSRGAPADYFAPISSPIAREKIEILRGDAWLASSEGGEEGGGVIRTRDSLHGSSILKNSSAFYCRDARYASSLNFIADVR